jgi:N utilization substance protein B
MSARSKARKRALDVLFESEQRSVQALDTLAGRVESAEPAVSEYTVALVEGVVANTARIDELLSTYSQDWSLDRMPAVDRAILRLATFELLWRDDVPDAVVIDEAVNLARSLSTDESPGFVNGLLGRLLDLKPDLVRPSSAAPDATEVSPGRVGPPG